MLMYIYVIYKEKDMLIAISGSQGSGKSVCINELQNRGYNVITRKTSRSILSNWGVTLSQVNNDHALTIRFQEEILKRKIEDEAGACVSTDVWFTERSFADLFIYAVIALGKDNEYSEWLNQYYVKCGSAQDLYTGIFYITGGHFVPVHDGVRATNQHYSRMVDLAMTDYTKRLTWPTKLVMLDVPQLDQRIETIINTVQNYNNKKGLNEK